jgi:hypothetical protein
MGMAAQRAMIRINRCGKVRVLAVVVAVFIIYRSVI